MPRPEPPVDASSFLSDSIWHGFFPARDRDRPSNFALNVGDDVATRRLDPQERQTRGFACLVYETVSLLPAIRVVTRIVELDGELDRAVCRVTQQEIEMLGRNRIEGTLPIGPVQPFTRPQHVSDPYLGENQGRCPGCLDENAVEDRSAFDNKPFASR